MSNNKSSVAVIGDLTALYSVRTGNEETHTWQRKSINYENLDRVLKSSLGVDKLDLSLWYTIFSAYNDIQVSFVEGLRDMGWEVETMHPRQIHHGMRPTDYRFDSRIAYQLGLAVGDHSKIIVVSDSYDLLGPLKELHEDDPDMEINLAFFSESLDGRWWRTLNNKNGFIRFLDLDAELYG